MRFLYVGFISLLLALSATGEVLLKEFRTDYPYNIYYQSGSGTVPLGRTNTPLDPSLAREVLEHPEQIILAPVWTPTDQVTREGVLIRDFVQQGINTETGAWPNKGVYRPVFETSISVRLFLRYRWPWLLGIGALLSLALVGMLRVKGQLRQKEDLVKRHETLQLMLDDLPKDDPRLGKRFGKHILMEKIGSGGMAIEEAGNVQAHGCSSSAGNFIVWSSGSWENNARAYFRKRNGRKYSYYQWPCNRTKRRSCGNSYKFKPW